MVIAVAYNENVLGALAEGGDAGIVHAHLALQQHIADVGQQARAVGADQTHQRPVPGGGRAEFDAGRGLEVPKPARQQMLGRLDAGRVLQRRGQGLRDAFGIRRVAALEGDEVVQRVTVV